MTEVSAVPTGRRRAASGTGAYFRSCGRDHPVIAVPLEPKNPDARPREPNLYFSACSRLSAEAQIKPNSTESEADPHEVQIDKLNIRYILDSSVQRAGARMRVDVQLIDAERGKHLWAERFDKPLADLFDMQDEIVARLAGALNTELIAAEARRAEQWPNPDSIDLTFQGWAWWNKCITADNLAEARRLFERAAALDPANVVGLVGIASVNLAVATVFLPDDRAARIAAAEESLTKALSLAPENSIAHLLLGVVQMHTDRALQGIRSCERALDLDRNLAAAHAQIGDGKLLLGQPEETGVISRRRCASVPATVMSTSGACSPDWPNFSSAEKRRQSYGCAGRSKPTGIIRAHISFWGPLWRISAGSPKRGPKLRRDWQ